MAPNGIGCVRADGATPGDFWLDDAHARANGFVQTVEHARYGSSPRWGAQVHLSGSPESPGPGCMGGDHTRALLEELGYGATAVESLYARGTVWSEEILPL